MRTSISRRQLLQGLGLGVVAACGARDSFATPLVPTPAIDDGDADLPFPVADSCRPTADQIEGPFYKKGAPGRATLAGNDDRGERLLLTGTVRGADCKVLAGAVLDVWHANWRGDYDNDGFGFRGTLATDPSGRFTLHTIIPGRYLNGARYRPSHIHVKLRARGHTELTTQVYFAGDPYLDGDPFAVPSLVMAHERARTGRRAAFDFTLA